MCVCVCVCMRVIVADWTELMRTVANMVNIYRSTQDVIAQVMAIEVRPHARSLALLSLFLATPVGSLVTGISVMSLLR